MSFHLVRRSRPTEQPTISILILAANAEATVEMVMRVRALGFVVFEPRLGEDGRTAIMRLRPEVVMVQLGRSELDSVQLDVTMEAAGARLIVFGREWPAVVDAARDHAALSLPTDAPAKMMRSAFQLAVPA